MRRFLIKCALIAVSYSLSIPAFANTVTAKTKLLRGTVIMASDLDVEPSAGAPAGDALALYIGKEVVRTIYPGRALTQRDVSAPTLVRRNSRVKMVYSVGRLQINAMGRAMEQGGEGDIISVMNLDSRTRINGTINAQGTVEVTP